VDATLEELLIAEIGPNPENPRQVFRPAADERLASSIDTKGVLVPIYVYRSGDADHKYTLIDGERRWRQAKKLGRETIPALVRDEKPDDAENIIEMFNIHLVRAQWEEMPTALALLKVMERTGIEDADELKRLTGLSKSKISDYKLILDLPERYQDLIREGVPMNLFVEIEENVIRPLSRQRPKIWEKLSADSVRDSFLAKREAGALPDIVELRKMRPIIRQAAEDAGGPEEDSPFDELVQDLIVSKTATIEDAYTEVALAGVELDSLAGASRSLVAAVDRLIGLTEDNKEDRGQLKRAVNDTIAALQARLDQLG
jgi:ParB family transcriptional regulator, chromosome partitioning protein